MSEWKKQDNQGNERNTPVRVRAALREDFKGFGSNIGAYFPSDSDTELMVSARELEVLQEEGFLMVVELPKGSTPAPLAPEPPPPDDGKGKKGRK